DERCVGGKEDGGVVEGALVAGAVDVAIDAEAARSAEMAEELHVARVALGRPPAVDLGLRHPALCPCLGHRPGSALRPWHGRGVGGPDGRDDAAREEERGRGDGTEDATELGHEEGFGAVRSGPCPAAGVSALCGLCALGARATPARAASEPPRRARCGPWPPACLLPKRRVPAPPCSQGASPPWWRSARGRSWSVRTA